ncbi:MAG: hypothetical protein IPJ31_15085 [Bacteroidetes bacterium]|nr:hypothetical protein [Bacteroidota bacterium]
MHHETSVGSAAVLRGRGEVLVTLMDPIDAFSNGTGKFSTATGLASGHLTVAGFTEFGKANSLNGIEIAGDAVTFCKLEIVPGKMMMGTESRSGREWY